ncbi:hypothetical protein ScPMuIL_010006 [Solemya velum]
MSIVPRLKRSLSNKVYGHDVAISSVNCHNIEHVEDGGSNTREDTADDITVTGVWKDYATRTTLHGVRHIVNSDTRKSRRIAWLVFIIVMVTVLIALSSTQIIRYLRYPTVSKQYQTIAKKLEFPAVTICSLNKISDKSVQEPLTRFILKKVFTEINGNISYLKGLDPNVTKSLNLTKLFVDGAPKMNETFILCNWRNTIIECSDYFSLVLVPDGVCFAFNSREYIRKTGERLESVHPGSEDGLVVQLHAHQEDNFIGDSGAAGFKVSTNELVRVWGNKV